MKEIELYMYNKKIIVSLLRKSEKDMIIQTKN